jgi:hypothetical protein
MPLFTKPLIALIAICALAAGVANGKDKPYKTKPGRWVTLFDGKSTQALRGYKMEGFPSCWKVERGTLQAIATSGAVTDLITKEKFHDFELECQWKISPGGNSGIIYRVSEEKKTSWQTGPEYQLLDNTKHKDGGNPKTSSGALYAMIGPASQQIKPVGKWNTTKIVIKDNHVEHWLNGKKVVEYDWGSEALKTLIADSKFKSLPLFASQEAGHIAFQHHHNEVWFKKIKVRSL